MSPSRTVSILDEEGWSPIEENYKQSVFDFMKVVSSIRSVFVANDQSRIMIGEKRVQEVPISKSYSLGEDNFRLQEEKGNPNRLLLIESGSGGRTYPLIVHYSSYYPTKNEKGETVLRKRYKIKEDLSPVLRSPPRSPPKEKGKSPVQESPSMQRGRSPPPPSVANTRFSAKDCEEWKKNKTINPKTGRKIRRGKKIYNELAKGCE